MGIAILQVNFSKYMLSTDREEEYTSAEKTSSWKKWIVRASWFLAIALVFLVVYIFYSLAYGDLPSFTELENPKYDVASIVYDANNKSFGKYYIENRENVNFEELSPYVVDALIATEDERFYSHSGIDLRALFRVALRTVLLSDEDGGGGSTISQQLAKLLFDRPSLRGKGKLGRGIALAEIKLKEWITAVKLEKEYTKEEIIAMYLNKFEFINGAHGIQAAAETYFGKRQNELQVEEAAVLVGMLKNPSLYNPKRFAEKSKDRRNVVLSQLLNQDKLEQSQFDTLASKPIDMSGFKRKTQSDGLAPYFRAELTKWLKDLLDDEAYQKPDGGSYNIYKDGLKIYTTLDLQYQQKAEEAVIEHMKVNQAAYWRTWKGKNPWTYEATDEQKEIRADILSRRVKESDRYLNMRSKYLDNTIDKIRQKYENLPVSDNVIKALIDIEANRLSYNAAIEAGKIKKEYLSDYKSLLNKNAFSQLKKDYAALEEAFESDFKKTKIKMMVYDYNEDGEVEKEMTPYDSVKYHNQHLQAGMLAVDPHTGYIKAWVGGINHKYFKYDHVNSRRQVGSTIKPFVYTTAIALQGISPCQQYDDIQYTIAPGDANFDMDREWSPANANELFTGNKYNLYQGLLYSKNSITVRIVKEMGNVDVIRELLDNVGIEKDKRLPSGGLMVPRLPSISLGAVDLSLLDMTGAYTTFSNNGVYTEPIFVARIEDKNGKVIYNGVPDRNIAINPAYNAVMVDMLKNNVGAGFGMGTKTPVGGKTGTTNDYADGWFMGITPNLVVGTWVGGDDKWIRFLTLDQGQGFVMARPIFQKFLKKLEKDTSVDYNPDVKFQEPPIEYFDIVDCDKYKQILPEDERQQTRLEKAAADAFEEDFEESDSSDFEFIEEEEFFFEGEEPDSTATEEEEE